MIPERYDELLAGAHTAVLTTVLPDGGPMATPVWFLRDGDRILVSSLKDRQKQRNVERQPQVSLALVDPADPFHYVEVRGTAEVADDPDYEVRDRVVRKHGYDDGSGFDAPGARRVAITISPTRVLGR